MFFDSFKQEYTTETDEYAPPERYVRTLRGKPGVYVDVWSGEKDGNPNSEMRIEYTEEEYYSDIHNKRFFEKSKEINFKPKILSCFILPEAKFDEYVKRFELE